MTHVAAAQPCPHCRGEAALYFRGPKVILPWYVRCARCQRRTAFTKDSRSALLRWADGRILVR